MKVIISTRKKEVEIVMYFWGNKRKNVIFLNCVTQFWFKIPKIRLVLLL